MFIHDIAVEAFITIYKSSRQGKLVAQFYPTLCDPMDSPPVPLSMEFSRQEDWSGLPFPSAGDLPDSRIKPGSPAFQADSLPTELLGKPPIYKSSNHKIKTNS